MSQQSSAMGGKNSTKFLLILGFVVVVLIIVASASALLINNKTRPNAAVEGCDDQRGKEEVTLDYKANEEFGPDCLRISTGTKIIYKNDSQTPLEIGADPHPIHNGNREVSNDEFSLSVAPGKTASAVLKKKGEFGFHNHQNPSARATIIVE